MRNSIVTMLQKLSEIRPVVIVLNRFQLASKSTMQLSNSLLQVKNKNIGIVLGVNDVQSIPEFAHEEWVRSVRVWMTGTWCIISEMQAGTWNRMSWTITLIMRVTMAIGN